MDPNDHHIEIFAPFGEAFDLTKKILFQPFDLSKWFVIGFAAWLATFFSGGGYSYRRYFRHEDWHWHAHRYGSGFYVHDMSPWVIPFVIVGALVAIALIALLLWLNARGRFIFTDCIVRNRAAIAAPWREFHEDANRYFVFQIVVAFCSIFVFGGLGFLYWEGWYRGNPVIPLALLILFAVALVLIAIVVGLGLHLMVPVMYRRRCGAGEAFGAVWSLVAEHPGIFILFVLFYILLCVAAGMIGCIAACVTCCIAAIPYIGTVILLPVVMVLFAFPLCFLRQFGDLYDVWAVVRSTEPPLPPVPPVQESPTPS